MHEIYLTLAKLNLFHAFYIQLQIQDLTLWQSTDHPNIHVMFREDKRDQGCRVGIDVIKN